MKAELYLIKAAGRFHGDARGLLTSTPSLENLQHCVSLRDIKGGKRLQLAREHPRLCLRPPRILEQNSFSSQECLATTQQPSLQSLTAQLISVLRALKGTDRPTFLLLR